MEEVITQESKNEVALIFEKINTGLQAFEERKAALTLLANEAEKIKGAEKGDKTHRKWTTEHRKKMKSARVEIEKEGKSMRDPLTTVNKQISSKEKELVAIVSTGEKDLEEIEDWYDQEDARIEREATEAEAKRVQARIDALSRYGYAIDLNLLTGLSDEQFEKVRDDARILWEKEESIKAEEAQKAKKEQERIQNERIELEELRTKKAAADKIIEEREQEKIAVDRQREKEKVASRCKQLSDLGLVFDFSDNHYKNFDCFVHTFDITGYDDEKWAAMIEKMGPHIEEWKKRKQEEDTRKQQERLEEARLEGIGKGRREMLAAINGACVVSDVELGQIDDAKWKQDYQIAKSLHDKRQKELDAQKEKERQELLGEKQRYEELVSAIKAIKIPDFRSGQYRSKVNPIREFIDGLK